MADIDIGGTLPSLTAISITTTSQSVSVPAYARAVYIVDAVADLLYSFDDATWASAPAAALFEVWNKGSAAPESRTFYVKLSTGGPTATHLDARGVA